MDIKTFRLGELFCGPGGLACGALKASVEGFKTEHASASDYDPDTCSTYRRNITPDNPESVICEDVRNGVGWDLWASLHIWGEDFKEYHLGYRIGPTGKMVQTHNILFAQHGHYLGGESPLWVQYRQRRRKPLAEDKCKLARACMKEVGGKIPSQRTGTGYEAGQSDESAK